MDFVGIQSDVASEHYAFILYNVRHFYPRPVSLSLKYEVKFMVNICM